MSYLLTAYAVTPDTLMKLVKVANLIKYCKKKKYIC